MKRALTLAFVPLIISCQMKSSDPEQELLKVERDFAAAVLSNDADAIGKFLIDDWAIVDADGGVIDRARFLSAIKSGTLVHEEMELDDLTVRAYGDSAVVTTITSTKRSVCRTRVYNAGTRDGFLCEARRPLAVCVLAADDI